MNSFYVNKDLKTNFVHFRKGQFYVSSDKVNHELAEQLVKYANKHNNQSILKAIKFCDTSEVLKRAIVGNDFKNLLIIRYGGIGDLIALTSIMDYFEDKNIRIVTQEKYKPLFEWFTNTPELCPIYKPVFSGMKWKDKRLDSWAEFNGNGVVEAGHSKNWYEVFFELSGIEHDESCFRPQLKTERINDNQSNIQRLSTGKPSILICNKATAMMRTCKASTIIDSIPNKEKYDIFVHDINLVDKEEVDAIVIEKSNLATFFLDCYDANMVISVDTGAIHFREGIDKPAIGLYNSFTTDARTKYYQYTKSFDIKSECDLQPCFLHEQGITKHCPKGSGSVAPCFDSELNKTLKEQLIEIFKTNL